MKIINLDKFVDNLPLACSEYRIQIKSELNSLLNEVIDLCAKNAELQTIKHKNNFEWWTEKRIQFTKQHNKSNYFNFYKYSPRIK